MNGLHVGRSWAGHEVEDDCPCPKAPCGLAAPKNGVVCEHHNPSDYTQSRTMRQVHQAKDCPA
jgi:hypothetical protein